MTDDPVPISAHAYIHYSDSGLVNCSEHDYHLTSIIDMLQDPLSPKTSMGEVCPEQLTTEPHTSEQQPSQQHLRQQQSSQQQMSEQQRTQQHASQQQMSQPQTGHQQPIQQPTNDQQKVEQRSKLEGTSFSPKTTLTLETALSLYGMTESQSFWEIEQDTRCLMGWGNNTVVVSFRGTASMRNALADLQV